MNNVEASFNETPVIGIVNRDFLLDGKVVLVPHGTQVLGVAGKVENQAQARLFMGFHRAIFPSGRSAFFPQSASRGHGGRWKLWGGREGEPALLVLSSAEPS